MVPNIGFDLTLTGAVSTPAVAGFSRLSPPAYVPEPAARVVIAGLLLRGWTGASARVLHPFSWDADQRGFELDDLSVGEHGLGIVSGPFSTADAAALELGPDTDFDLPGHPGDQAHRYLAHGATPSPESRHQDAAGWFTVTARSASDEPVALALALDTSSTVVTSLAETTEGLELRCELPRQTFSPSTPQQLPEVLVRVGSGGHERAEDWLRRLLAATIPVRSGGAGLAGPLTPPLIADTWGAGTAITPESVTAFMDSAAELGVEVITVDKGWEAEVGDWWAKPTYEGGIPGLAGAAHERDMSFGLWCAAGNAAPASSVARAHPDWLASWRGRPMILSHDNYALCLGHQPAREHVLAALDTLVEQGVDWLLHDFETIARCDSAEHTHDPGAGERAAENGWYAVLAEVRQRHPTLVIENCWNGGRPLDLRMLAHHDTTIGDDWARSGFNRIAKLGLGRYLPSSWTSCYMSDEKLPPRAQLAPYVVGGPWILMGDLPRWNEERRALMSSAIAVYKAWRSPSFEDRVVAPVTSAPVAAVATTPRANGAQLAAFVIGANEVGADIRWFPVLAGADLRPAVLTDEWTGATRALAPSELAAGIRLDTAAETGLILSVRPA